MARNPNEDTEPRVQRLFVGHVSERSMGRKPEAGARLCVYFCASITNLLTLFMFYLVPLGIWIASIWVCVTSAQKIKKSVPLAVALGALVPVFSAVVYGYMAASGERNPTKIAIASIALYAVLIGGSVMLLSGVNNTRQASMQKIVVENFADAGRLGYAVSVPSGNASICEWTWADDMGAPQSKTLEVAVERHVLTYRRGEQNPFHSPSVECEDNLGNHYVGLFTEW